MSEMGTFSSRNDDPKMAPKACKFSACINGCARRVSKKRKIIRIYPRNYKQVKSSPSLTVWSHEEQHKYIEAKSIEAKLKFNEAKPS